MYNLSYDEKEVHKRLAPWNKDRFFWDIIARLIEGGGGGVHMKIIMQDNGHNITSYNLMHFKFCLFCQLVDNNYN